MFVKNAWYCAGWDYHVTQRRDSLAGEFGGRHELYERNYSGNWEDARVQALQGAIASGEAATCTALVDQCLSEYDLDGWRLPGFINPDDVNVISWRQAR